MKIQPTNFGRQFKKALPTYLNNLYQGRNSLKHAKEITGLFIYAGEMSEKAVRFILPDGGEILEDREFRAVEDTVLRLPFPVIALEYFENTHNPVGIHTVKSSKRMVIAYEVFENEEIFIRIIPISWIDELQVWQPLPPISLNTKAKGSDLKVIDRETWELKCIHLHNYANYIFNVSDYMNEAVALFSFLNALACSNITTEKLSRKGPLNPRGMVPFDEYHVLTLPSHRSIDGTDQGGSHRSPREHLRRGHIRRLSDSRKIWVNAAIVNCGIGSKTKKDYAISKR
jgi:hypothetical protein